LRKLAFTIKNSTTIIRPEWVSILKAHAEVCKSTQKKVLSIRMMPRDVATRWNSTFDMLQFALAYCTPLDDLTGIREMKLRSYELSEEEWKIADQLAGVLDVSYTYT
jgi:hypothetical protein